MKGGGRMGTQKGRVDVQQQPPSLLQTPQLPGAAPARPEVTRLLPTTRLRLALPLSISPLPPSFALYSLLLSLSLSPFVSLSNSVSLSLSLPRSVSFIPLPPSCSSSLVDSNTPPLSFTCVHTRGMRVSLSLCLSSRELTPRGNTSGARFAASGSEAHGFSSALWNCRGGTRRRDAHVNAGYDVPRRAREQQRRNSFYVAARAPIALRVRCTVFL